ncbi:radical SAM protein [Rheinheimera sp. UJ51]|uniref:4Fe-4S single cluster domain-containing protein n=1 Tax=unclassified Rheinheimera TaxID=115860 RepID=UPI001E5165FD|nr:MULTISPECIES: 4Fe-4S single cluster domain-containing protein [unclassified Rheinheimera]MCC5452925.1 radical SAM protein [Rheinheimera sp. UJ51]MCF4010586.1 radical SAM protein [Rheinheimera sp. UJ63]
MKRNYGEYFNVAHIELQSRIYGPGTRYVIWLQGCSLACEGCWNTEMWSFKAKDLIHRETLLKQILSATDIKGITILGGEPLHQESNLLWLLKKIRRQTNLTIFVFTGFEEQELQSQGLLGQLLEVCDMLAVGRYISSQRNTQQQWIGSNNQCILYSANSREKQKQQSVNEVEICINKDSSVRMLGFPNEELIRWVNVNSSK